MELTVLWLRRVCRRDGNKGSLRLPKEQPYGTVAACRIAVLRHMGLQMARSIEFFGLQKYLSCFSTLSHLTRIVPILRLQRQRNCNPPPTASCEVSFFLSLAWGGPLQGVTHSRHLLRGAQKGGGPQTGRVWSFHFTLGDLSFCRVSSSLCFVFYVLFPQTQKIGVAPRKTRPFVGV